MNIKNWNWKKILKISGISIVSLITLLVLFIKLILPGILKDRLEEKLETTFDNYYSIEFESIETSITLKGQFSIKIVKPVFRSDTVNKLANDRFPIMFFEADFLEIKNIPFRDILSGPDIHIDDILLKNPELLFLYTSNEDSTDREPDKETASEDIFEFIQIETTALEGGVFKMANYKTPEAIEYRGEDINFKIDGFNVNPSQFYVVIRSTKAFSDINFFMTHAFSSPASLDYSFEMDSLEISYSNKLISMGATKIIPNDKLKELSEKEPYRKTFVNIDLSHAALTKINYAKLITAGHLESEMLALDNPKIAFLRNHTKPLDESLYKPTIIELINLLNIEVNIDSLKLSNGHFKINLLADKTEQGAQVSISDLQATLSPLQTEYYHKDTMIFHLEGKLFDEGDMACTILFPPGKESYNVYKGNIHDLSFSALNDLMWEFKSLGFTEGKIDDLYFDGFADQYTNKGKMYLTYHDLKIASYKDENGVKSKIEGLKSKLSNIFIKDTKQTGKGAHEVSYEFTREKHQGYGALYIGGLINGLRISIMGEKKAKLMPSQFN